MTPLQAHMTSRCYAWAAAVLLLVAAANADCRFSGNVCGGGACTRDYGFPRSGTCESNSGQCRCCSGLPGSPNRECWLTTAEVAEPAPNETQWTTSGSNTSQLVSPLSEASHKGTCGAADNEDDCTALLDFWRAMGSFTCDQSCQENPPYGGKGFADGTPLCGWYGIECDKSGRVNSLDFNNAEKECPIPITKYGEPGHKLPHSLGLLKGLDTIELALGLDGTVPASLGSLPKLKYIFLSYNGLSGTVPDSLGSLSNLEVLQLADNKLTGTVPDSFGNLTKLYQLRMDDNKITGFPNSICHLTSGYPDNGNLSDCMMGQNPLEYCPPCAKDRCDTFDDCPK